MVVTQNCGCCLVLGALTFSWQFFFADWSDKDYILYSWACVWLFSLPIILVGSVCWSPKRSENFICDSAYFSGWLRNLLGCEPTQNLCSDQRDTVRNKIYPFTHQKKYIFSSTLYFYHFMSIKVVLYVYYMSSGHVI